MKTVMKMFIVALCVAFASCNGTDTTVASLKNKEWKLQQVTSNGAALNNPVELPELQFADSSKVAGSAGCNRFFGSYEANDKGLISIKLGGSTMMMCPDMDFEEQYLKLLPQIASFAIEGKTLSLKSEDGKIVISYTLSAE